jgi:hypothetical protein
MQRGGRQLGVFHVAQTEQNAQFPFEIIQQNKPVFDHPASVNRTFVLLRLTPFWFVSGVCSDYSLKGFWFVAFTSEPERCVGYHAHTRVEQTLAWLRLSVLSLSSLRCLRHSFVLKLTGV